MLSGRIFNFLHVLAIQCQHFFLCLKKSWFVSRITQIILNRFLQTWMEEGSWRRSDPINFYCKSRNFCETGRSPAFFGNFSGNDAWMLLKKIRRTKVAVADPHKMPDLVDFNMFLFYILIELFGLLGLGGGMHSTESPSGNSYES